MCMSSPAAAAPPPVPAPPAAAATKASPAAKKARDDQRAAIRAMAGNEYNIRTTALGVLEQADKQSKKLLGQ